MLPEPRVSIRRNHDLQRYILPTETVVVATRRHWASLLEPAATAFGVFLAVAVVVFVAPPDLQDAVGWLWFVWLFFLGRFGFRWLEWAHEWFVSTDKRLLLLYGLVIHKVAMMPLTKVTDMGYSRTPVGQLLGYGRFVMESAGQDQALRQIDFVPHPDATYRTLCAEIFRPLGGKPTPDAGGRPQAPGHPGPTGPAPGRPVPDGSGQAPVVIVPGRPDVDEPRPTTQPIAVAGRVAAEPATTLLPPAVAPTSTSTPTGGAGRHEHGPHLAAPPPTGAPAGPRSPAAGASSSPGVPAWQTPPDWKRPKPYDSHPR